MGGSNWTAAGRGELDGAGTRTVAAVGSAGEVRKMLAQRAKIVLACADGVPNKDIAADLHVHPTTVTKWRTRFVKLRLDGLLDQDRPGRPPSITVDQVEDVVVATLEQTPRNATQWSRTSMAQTVRVE
jgi:transposase